MTRDDIIRMAREAGFVVDEVSQQHQPNCIQHTWYLIDEALERFAALVAAAERKACANELDEMAAQDKVSEALRCGLMATNYYTIAATAIRARTHAGK